MAVLELVPPELWWLVVIAFIAGLVDAAVGGGTPFIRKLFVGLVVVLIARMAWDTFRGA